MGVRTAITCGSIDAAKANRVLEGCASVLSRAPLPEARSGLYVLLAYWKGKSKRVGSFLMDRLSCA